MQPYSVLMSVYKKENPDYLRLSLESILAQTWPTDDLVLVCDGELTEALDAVIDEFLTAYPSVFHVIRFAENRGLGPALNDGLQYCKNEWVARMDSDDYAPQSRCQRQMEAISADPSLSIVGGCVEEFEGDPSHILSHKRMPLSHADILQYAKKRNPFNHPTIMMRRSVVLSVGGYPPLHLHEDYGLWVKILQSGAKTCNLPDTLCLMRVDNGLYARRGGLRYLQVATRFRYHLYRIKFINLSQLLRVVCALTLVCLFPTQLREFIYKKILRKH